MANTKEWADALKKINDNVQYDYHSTSEVYARIKARGLDTVIWKDFNADNLNIPSIKKFVNKNAPVLFIWDPIKKGTRKGYLANINNPEEIEKWLSDKRR